MEGKIIFKGDIKCLPKEWAQKVVNSYNRQAEESYQENIEYYDKSAHKHLSHKIVDPLEESSYFSRPYLTIFADTVDEDLDEERAWESFEIEKDLYFIYELKFTLTWYVQYGDTIGATGNIEIVDYR